MDSSARDASGDADLEPMRDRPAVVLEVLSAIELDARVTQRDLSNQLGIALGLANGVLKRCVRKGLIKISEAPLNRYAYYLTPSGFAEKSRLTVEYLRTSFDLFRDARRQYSLLFSRLRDQRLSRVVLIGASELAEAALLSARETGIEIVGLVDGLRAGEAYLGFTVAPSLDGMLANADAIVICDLRDPQASNQASIAAATAANLPLDRVVAPKLLRLSAKTNN